MSYGPTGAEFVLTLSCPDRPGIVHAVSGFLVERSANIVESQQFGDRLTDRFFMRIAFVTEAAAEADELRTEFARVAEPFGMAFELWDATAPGAGLVAVAHDATLAQRLLRIANFVSSSATSAVGEAA